MQDYIEYCEMFLSGNALIIKSKEQCKSIAPEANHLQEPKQHTEDAKSVCDTYLSSNDSYCVETNDNLSAEASCLDTHLENTNNVELERESCSTNVQGLEEDITNEIFVDDASFCEWIDNSRTDELASKGDELEESNTFEFFPTAKEEYYEVYPLDATKEEYYELYPYDAHQGKTFKFMFKYLILLLKLSREACSLHMVHPPSFGSKNLFIYKAPMHRKRVRLRPNYVSKCSKVRINNPLVYIY
jgi:hypothetical protein